MATQNTDITSANSQVIITVPLVFPSGFQVESFMVDSMFDIDAIETKETQMGADGKYRSGFIYNEIPVTMHLSAGSPSIEKFLDWNTREKTIGSAIVCNMKIVLPSRGLEFDFVTGYLRALPPAMSAARILSEFTVHLSFENCTYSKL